MPPQPPIAPRGLIALLAAVTATGPLAMQIFLPALPAVQADFGADVGTVQLTLSLSMVAIALSTLAYGPLSDRHGRRPVLGAGLVLFLLGTLICAFAPGIGVLIFGRIVQAAGGAAGMVLARAVVRDLYGAERATGVIAQLTMVMVVAPMVAPAIGGVLTDLFAWRAVFAFAALAGVLIAFWVALKLPESHVDRGRGEGAGDLLRGFALLLGSPRFCGYVGQTAFSSAIFFSFISGAPYLMVNTLGRPATEYGLWFVAVSAGFMTGNFLAIRTSGRFPQLALMLTGSLVGLFGILLIVAIVLSGHLSPPALFLPAGLAMVGSGLAMPNAQAGAINVFPRKAGTASGFSGFAQMTVAAIATQAVGVLQNGTAWPMLAFMTCGAVGALASITVVWRAERARPGVVR
ncbi:MAG TPA: multidrug effflux MFS transporter [Pseudomonadales bacterium]|nr:multidrug effflux MFS transporter [Pseudomonadales bacterium]